MKAEHRKELETNLLADRMGKLVQRMRTRPQRRSILIALLAVVAVVALVVWNYIREDRRSSLANRWYIVERGTSPVFRSKEDVTLDMVAGYQFGLRSDKKAERRLGVAGTESEFDNPGKAARLEVARYWLWDMGIKKLGKPNFPEIMEAGKEFVIGLSPLQRIDLAEDVYTKLVAECESESETEWKAEALFGLAVIEETRALQDIQKLTRAKEKYKTLSDTLGKTGHGKLALKRYNDLHAHFADATAFYQDMKRELNMPALPKAGVR